MLQIKILPDRGRISKPIFEHLYKHHDFHRIKIRQSVRDVSKSCRFLAPLKTGQLKCLNMNLGTAISKWSWKKTGL